MALPPPFSPFLAPYSSAAFFCAPAGTTPARTPLRNSKPMEDDARCRSLKGGWPYPPDSLWNVCHGCCPSFENNPVQSSPLPSTPVAILPLSYFPPAFVIVQLSKLPGFCFAVSWPGGGKQLRWLFSVCSESGNANICGVLVCLEFLLGFAVSFGKISREEFLHFCTSSLSFENN